jgi:hypothetical protein
VTTSNLPACCCCCWYLVFVLLTRWLLFCTALRCSCLHSSAKPICAVVPSERHVRTLATNENKTPNQIFDSSPPRKAEPFLNEAVGETVPCPTATATAHSRAVRDANGNKRALTPHPQQTAVYAGLETQYSSFLLLSQDTDAVV